MARKLLGKLAQLDTNIDIGWFDYFDPQLSLGTKEPGVASEQLIRHLRQINEVAFDLDDGRLVPKSYFFRPAQVDRDWQRQRRRRLPSNRGSECGFWNQLISPQIVFLAIS
jgi:hypothetical protein